MLKTNFRNLILKHNVTISSVINISHKRNYSSNSGAKIVRSKMPKIIIPNAPLEEIMFERFEQWPSKIAMECSETGRSYTYSDIQRKCKSLANFLHKLKNLEQNDTVAVLLPNVPEYPIVFLGAVLAGLKVTTINSAYTADEIARQLRDSDAKLVFTLNGPWYSTTIQALQNLPDKKIPVVVINHQQNQTTPVGAIKFDEIVNNDPRINFTLTRKDDDVLALPYSSGTTGLPKGVQLTNKNLVTSILQIEVEPISYLFQPEDVVPLILPMYHIYGLIVLMLTVLSNGCKLITVPKFEPQLFYTILDKHKPTLSFLVPPLILLLISSNKVRIDHLQRMKCIYSGAAPLGASDIQRLREKAKTNVRVIQGYGLTETVGVCIQTDVLPNGVKPGGSGLVLSETEVKIVSLDDDNVTLGPNQSGELLVRGPQIMKGYYKNPEATAETIDQEGWLRTGDVAHYDEDEHFFITDRLKELIKVKGLQVAPAELEELLRNHPDIDDAAVIGIPHPISGEEPKAFVVPKNECSINELKIQEYVANKVAKHKQLTGGVVVLDSIPKSPSGKILRRELRSM